MSLELINKYINKYLIFVFNHDTDDDSNLWCEKPYNKLDNYFMNEFKFSSGNNWINGFNFVDWLNGINDMKDFYKVKKKCGIYDKIILNITDLYIDNIVNFETLSEETIICIYVNNYIENLSLNDIQSVLFRKKNYKKN
jgi:hypothetical protein